MDIASTGGVASVKKVELSSVSKSNSDKGYAKPDPSRRDVLNLDDDARKNYLKNALGRHKPVLSFGDHDLDEKIIEEQIENGEFEVDIDQLAERLKNLL